MKIRFQILSIIVLCGFGVGEVKAQNSLPPLQATLSRPDADDGRHLLIQWGTWKDQEPDLKAAITAEEFKVARVAIFRTELEIGNKDLPPPFTGAIDTLIEGEKYGAWRLVAFVVGASYEDQVTDPKYAMYEAIPHVWMLHQDGKTVETYNGDLTNLVPTEPVPEETPLAPKPRWYGSGEFAFAIAMIVPRNIDGVKGFTATKALLLGPMKPRASWFDFSMWFIFVVILLLAIALAYYTRVAKRNPESIYIRRIPGVDAIEESIGRSTEMGRPVLYVTGTDEITDIQTIASLLILGYVAEMVAEYDTEMKVANCYPLTMVVAEEIVRQGFANAGRIDAHKPENVMYISSEQFAFAAGINGLILRDRPATNIYLGKFFAESLILAETGFVTKAVQIAGTAEFTQLPFFLAACDYTLMGEELYAVSAYMSREPGLVAMLKASDFLKFLILSIVIIGAIATTFSLFDLKGILFP